MTTKAEFRRVDCYDCGAEVHLRLQHGYDGPDVKCEACGAQITNDAIAKKLAAERFPRLADAVAMLSPFTFEQVMDIARRIYDGGAAPGDMDVVLALTRTRMDDVVATAAPTAVHH